MRRSRLFAALVSIPLLSGVAQPAVADTPAPAPLTLTGDAVVHYGTNDYAFAETSRLIRQGTRDAAGGCTFDGTETSGAGDSVDEIDMAFDVATCRLLVRRGTLLDDTWLLEAEEADADGGSHRDKQVNTGTGTGTTGLMSAAAASRSAYTWSWYDEPARWAFGCDVADGFAEGCYLPPVNTVRNTVTWTPDGTCALAPGTTGQVTSSITWLVYTGWRVVSDSWSHSPAVVTCPSQIYSVNNNHFKNAIFCQALINLLPIPDFLKPDVDPTNTYYRPNEVRGYANGSASHYWSLSKSGGCESLLRSGRRFGGGLG